MIENGIYKFKEEFCKILQIPTNQYDKRQEELFEWLKNYFDYEILFGRPIRIVIKAVYGEYQPMPRKVPSQDNLNQIKEEYYTNYTIQALGTEFKPNSKTKVSRDAINNGGEEKFGHSYVKGITEKFIKPVFDKYGESQGIKTWVYYSSYEPISEDVLEDWVRIKREESIGEDEAANAFYRYAEGEDISEELNYYQKAIQRFREKYGDIPVCVDSWRLKKEVSKIQ